jgi:hypothetical protein
VRFRCQARNLGGDARRRVVGTRGCNRSAEPEPGSDVSSSPTEPAASGPYATAHAESRTDAACPASGTELFAVIPGRSVEFHSETSSLTAWT